MCIRDRPYCVTVGRRATLVNSVLVSPELAGLEQERGSNARNTRQAARVFMVFLGVVSLTQGTYPEF